jgi:nitrogen fixation-related uncharacterized protein
MVEAPHFLTEILLIQVSLYMTTIRFEVFFWKKIRLTKYDDDVYNFMAYLLL